MKKSLIYRGIIFLMLFIVMAKDVYTQADLDLYPKIVSSITYDTSTGLLEIPLIYIQSSTNEDLLNGFVLAYYLSSDTIYDANDYSVTYLYITPSMMALGGGYYPTSFGVYSPAPGNWYVLIVVDADNDLQELNENNNIISSEMITIGEGGSTDISNNLAHASSDLILKQNYPNPFNEITWFKFYLPESGSTILKIYDITGKIVKTLIEKPLSKGFYEYKFNNTNLPSGTYFFNITSNNVTKTKKMTINDSRN